LFSRELLLDCAGLPSVTDAFKLLTIFLINTRYGLTREYATTKTKATTAAMIRYFTADLRGYSNRGKKLIGHLPFIISHFPFDMNPMDYRFWQMENEK
jgi:hypothetical protein